MIQRTLVRADAWMNRLYGWRHNPLYHSGALVVALFLVLVCGWTGFVMVWDVQGQVLAQEGARLFDVLPIFAEPIGRAFVGERAIPGAFFFLNLFAHIALPIGLGLLVW